MPDRGLGRGEGSGGGVGPVPDWRFCTEGSFLSRCIHADVIFSGAERTQTEEAA